MADVVQDHNVFHKEVGHCGQAEPCTVITEGPPIKQCLYRKIVEEEIEKMLEATVIKPSSSPWACPITLVPKKEGTTRFCVDYCQVNAVK